MNESSDVLSVKQWLGTLFLMCIPLVGFIMLLVWAFGSNSHGVKKVWAKAAFFTSLICTGFSFIIMLLLSMGG